MRRAILLFVIMSSAASVYAQDRSHARSMVITEQGIVATSHALASQAGAQILAKGGSAVDAAIAANAVLGVTEPMMCGIGGDLFVIYYEAKTGKITGLNASGWAPKTLTPQYLAGKGMYRMPIEGVHTILVPGAVDGWSKMHKRFGKLPWATLFSSAIHYAQRGYPVPEIVQMAWYGAAGAEQRVNAQEESRRVFLPKGRAPEVGEIFRNPDLANTMETLAKGGADAFYRGPIAKKILAAVDKFGGAMTAEDMAEYSAEWVQPISTEYRGWRVYELPPNGQGMAVLEILNILEQFKPATGAAEIHKRVEATKLAYYDLEAYNADPRHSKVPVEQLLSKEYAKKRAALLNPDKATCSFEPGKPSDTVYLSVVDREGNIASWIQSISAPWGSGIVPEGSGFQLQNRGANFTLDKDHPNLLAGRKRSFHTIIPAFMQKDNVSIGFGIMGGANQPLAHAQFVSNVVDFGMNIQAALEAPRFTKLGAAGCDIIIEDRVGPDTLADLRKLGHNLDVRLPYSMRMGRGQAVLHDSKTKVNYGASDPRSDGSAEPEPLP